jgi:hypothetical protein
MTHIVIKTGATLLALGGFAVAGPAIAVSPLPLNDTAPVLIPIQDEENAEVWHDLRPDVTPPAAAVGKEGEAPKNSAAEPPKEEGSGGDVENEEVWHDLRPDVTPPPAATGE